MDIEGPISVGVLDKDNGASRELHINFRPEFQALPLEQQGADFAAYVDTLAKALVDPATSAADRPGIDLIHQICTELLPHVQAGEIALNEQFIIEIGLGMGLAGLAEQPGNG